MNTWWPEATTGTNDVPLTWMNEGQIG